MVSVDENTCKAYLTVRLSPTFYGWLFQFGDKMRLLEPAGAVEEFARRVDAAKALYSEE
jgi:hypothetical protein